jgi:hypothetical protein
MQHSACNMLLIRKACCQHRRCGLSSLQQIVASVEHACAVSALDLLSCLQLYMPADAFCRHSLGGLQQCMRYACRAFAQWNGFVSCQQTCSLTRRVLLRLLRAVIVAG